MKLFTLPFRRRQNNPGNEVIPTSPQPTFYTFDFDPASERFFALFCHGTSSENLQQILREGLRRPQLGRILDEVLRERPDLLLRREFLESIAAQAILSMKRREEEAGIFATWLANPSALWRMTQDIPSIVRHGGEVYAVAWRAISDELRRGQEEELLPRFADAASSAIFFRAPFYHGMVEEGTFSTNAGQLLYYARNLTAEDLVGEDYPIEVRFMNELPPEEIIWSGSLAEARQVLHSQLFSPAAREALGIRTDTSIEEDDDILG